MRGEAWLSIVSIMPSAITKGIRYITATVISVASLGAASRAAVLVLMLLLISGTSTRNSKSTTVITISVLNVICPFIFNHPSS